jgi:hypothetical protein
MSGNEGSGVRYVAQMFRARNDVNGNPRGWWLLRSIGDDASSTWAGPVVDAFERGYQWSDRMPDVWRRPDVVGLGRVDVDAAGLREVTARAASILGTWAVVDDDGDVWRRAFSRSAADKERRELARVFAPRTFRVSQLGRMPGPFSEADA